MNLDKPKSVKVLCTRLRVGPSMTCSHLMLNPNGRVPIRYDDAFHFMKCPHDEQDVGGTTSLAWIGRRLQQFEQVIFSTSSPT